MYEEKAGANDTIISLQQFIFMQISTNTHLSGHAQIQDGGMTRQGQVFVDL